MRLCIGATYSKSKRLGLHIEQHHVLVCMGVRQIGVRLSNADEVHRHPLAALVNQLKVGMLTVIAQPAPQNRRGCNRAFTAIYMHAFAIGFHVLLL